MQMEQDQINQQVLVILLKKIIELLGTSEPMQEEISVSNLDEIKASLKNELSGVIKAIKKSSNLSPIIIKINDLQKSIEKLDFSPSINVDAAQVTIPEIKIPEINVPQPFVTVNVPDVIVPEINVPQPIVNVQAPVINVPEVNLEEIIRSLEVNLNKIRTNSETRPLAVRLTDGQSWIKELRAINKQAAQTTQFMSDVSYIRNAAGLRINPATEESVAPPTKVGNGKTTVTTAGTRVALGTSTAIRSITVKALFSNTGSIYVGDSSVSSANGLQLQASESVSTDISNINKINIDSSINGEGVTYLWVN